MQRCARLVMLIFSLVVLSAVESTAEPPYDLDRPPTKEQMAKVRERIETLRMWKLTRALELDEKTSARLFPLLNKYDKKRVDIELSLWSGIKELRDDLREKRDGRLKDILDKLEGDHRALQKVNDEERSDVRRILTIQQQAKFFLFQLEFNREIRRIIAETRDKRLQRQDRPGGHYTPERP